MTLSTASPVTPTEQQGFSLRPPNLGDIAAVVKLLNDTWLDEAGSTFAVEDVMRADWQEPGQDYTKTIRLAVDGDQVVGYISIYSKPPYVRNSFFGVTHPNHRGRGIGSALATWGEQAVTENIPLAPAHARVTLDSSVIHTNHAATHMLSNLGFRHIRSGYEMRIEMTSPPPQPVWPEGISVRSMIPDQEEEAVYRALNESFRDHWGYVERPFEEAFSTWLYHVRNYPSYDPNFFAVAVDGDEIAGFALCFPKDSEFADTCWLNWLGVRRPWRRRGLALALLQHAFDRAYRHGIRKVGLGVDAESLTGATRLYEKAGMHVYRQWDTYQKELRAGEDLSTQQLA